MFRQDQVLEKTRVVVEKVKYMVNTLGVKPESFLIITFSTKAADELKERLIDGNIPASDVQKMHISTIHSFCLDILEKTGTVGLDVVADDGKLGLFIKKHISDLGFDNEFYLRGNYWIGKVIEKYDDFSILKRHFLLIKNMWNLSINTWKKTMVNFLLMMQMIKCLKNPIKMQNIYKW